VTKVLLSLLSRACVFNELAVVHPQHDEIQVSEIDGEHGGLRHLCMRAEVKLLSFEYSPDGRAQKRKPVICSDRDSKRSCQAFGQSPDPLTLSGDSSFGGCTLAAQSLRKTEDDVSKLLENYESRANTTTSNSGPQQAGRDGLSILEQQVGSFAVGLRKIQQC
jgi:hypothetical protein